jgi:hypothetical protein
VGLHRRRRPPEYRIEHWEDGAAAVLGHHDDPALLAAAVADLGRVLRIRGRCGSVVVIRQETDAIHSLCPIDALHSEPVPRSASAAARPSVSASTPSVGPRRRLGSGRSDFPALARPVLDR